jgi:hypothetical protein
MKKGVNISATEHPQTQNGTKSKRVIQPTVENESTDNAKTTAIIIDIQITTPFLSGEKSILPKGSSLFFASDISLVAASRSVIPLAFA